MDKRWSCNAINDCGLWEDEINCEGEYLIILIDFFNDVIINNILEASQILAARKFHTQNCLKRLPLRNLNPQRWRQEVHRLTTIFIINNIYELTKLKEVSKSIFQNIDDSNMHCGPAVNFPPQVYEVLGASPSEDNLFSQYLLQDVSYQ